MRKLITVNKIGEVATTIISNDPNLTISKDLILIEVLDPILFEKIQDNPRFYALRNNAIFEKSDEEKQAMQDKINRNRPDSLQDIIKRLEKRITDLEQHSTKP